MAVASYRGHITLTEHLQRVNQTYQPNLVDDAESWEARVLEAQAVSTSEIINEGRTEQKTIEVARNASEWLDRLTAAFYADCMPRLACKEGCSYCCSVPVDVSAPEVFAIAEHLKATRSKDELDALRHRIDDYLERHAGLSHQDRRMARVVCPLLESNRCSIYRVRPLSCRGWNSYDVEQCKRDYEAPVKAGGIEVFAPQFKAAQAVKKGVRVALEAAGLEHKKMNLVAALKIALETEDTLKRWLSGEGVFREAEEQAVS